MAPGLMLEFGFERADLTKMARTESLIDESTVLPSQKHGEPPARVASRLVARNRHHG